MRKSLFVAFLFLFVLHGLAHGSGSQPGMKEYRKANKLFSAGRYQDAIRGYKQTLNYQPDGIPASEIYTKIADSYFHSGNFKGALAAYKNALRHQERSERVETQYWIGFCTLLIGRDAEAVREFMKIPEFYPDAGMWVATAYYWAGRASERMGNKDDAAWYYNKASGVGKSAQGRHARKRAENVKR